MITDPIPDFDVMMVNQLHRSTSGPSMPTLPRAMRENLRVVLCGSGLAVSALKTPCRAAPSRADEVAARLYARRSFSHPLPVTAGFVRSDIFMILPELPPEGLARHFIAAMGSLIIWHDDETGRLRLRASGANRHSEGRDGGWMFDATEIREGELGAFTHVYSERINPPSTRKLCPVMYAASSEARKAIVAATSSLVP